MTSNKQIFHTRLIIFFSMLCIINSIETGTSEIFVSNINHTFPTTVTLASNKIIMVTNDGFFLYDSELGNEQTLVTFSKNFSDYSNIKIGQLSLKDDGYAFIIAKQILYIFTKNGELYDNFTAPYSSVLVPYNKTDNFLYYILGGDEGSKTILCLYKYDLTLKKYEVVAFNDYTMVSQLPAINCILMFPKDLNKNVLNCAYNLYEQANKKFRLTSFDIENNLTSLSKYSIVEDADDISPIILSQADENKSKALIITLKSDSKWRIFDIDNVLLSNETIFNASCGTKVFGKYRLYYFQKNKEFIFGCVNDCCTHYMFNFGKEFNLKEQKVYLPDNCYGINCFSVVYSYTKEKYLIVIDDGKKDTKAVSLIDFKTNGANKTEEYEIEEEKTKKIQPASEDGDLIPIELKCPKKCETCSITSLLNNNYCLTCNLNDKYYPVDFEYKINEQNDFIECYSELTKPENFYFDSENEVFKPCYELCKTCEFGGNKSNNNCTSCGFDLIFRPREITKNCVSKCPYLYFYNLHGQYKCTESNNCPSEANLLIKNLSECTKKCNIEGYKYQYFGQCLEKCPDGTVSEKSVCVVKNKEVCSLSEIEIESNDNLKADERINYYAENYANEFSNTNKHIILVSNENYKIILYKKNSDCIKQLKIDMPQIDFGECYTKVKTSYSITDDLIISIFQNFTENLTSTSFFFYNPKTGSKLDINEICKDENITISKNIETLLNNSNIDIESALYLAKQKIDIFNQTNEFYTDICYDFESPNGKDVVLKDRLLIFFPNITLCDTGCIYKGINFTAMKCICQCKFNSIINSGILDDNAIINRMTHDIEEFVQQSNLIILKCFKKVFSSKNMAKCVGSYIFYAIIFFELISSFVFYIYEWRKISKFIYYLSEYFINFQKNLLNGNEKNNIINDICKSNARKNTKRSATKKATSKSKNKLLSLKDQPPKRIKNFVKIIDDPNSNNTFKKNSINNIEENNIDNEMKNKPLELNNGIQKRRTKDKKRNTTISKSNYNSILSNGVVVINTKNRLNSKAEKNNKKFDSKISLVDLNKVLGKINFDEYLSINLNDMDFEDAYKSDNRRFCEFFKENLIKNQIFINTFYYKDNIRPLSIKILLLLLNIDLYFTINGIFFSEDYISERYHDTNEEKFFSFFSRMFNRFIWTYISGTIISLIIECIFIEEKKIKGILLREKNSPLNLKSEISQIMENIKKRYLIFICLCIFIGMFSWYHVSCFNDVYPNMRGEWIKSSIAIFIIRHILTIFIVLLEGIFRFVSFECKSEKIYKFSKLFS